jgi:thiopurine S-methyltransferase
LQHEFWLDRWRMGQIGFHQSAVDRHLKQFWPQLGLASNSRAFVPMCGKSLDLLWLRDRGHCVAGVELSAVALASFCMEHGIPSRRRILHDFEVYESAKLQLFCGDFFSLTPELLGSVSAIYDRAALIAWPPELREAYVQHMSVLTAPGTKTLLVAMEYPQAQMTGPPFSIGTDDIDRLYTRNHAVRELSRQDILASEPRLRSRGVTRLHEVCYQLMRLY